MNFIDVEIEGLKILEPRVFEDSRGYFYESYNENVFVQNGITNKWVQDNQSYSQYGVVRGLHYQVPPFAQAKLVRVIQGEVLDVVVDIRPNSSTYGKHFSVILSETNKKQFFIPRGFAHGYAVLSQTAVFFYKCDNFYSKQHEGGLFCQDPNLEIDWQLKMEDIILSEKDKVYPDLGQHRLFG